MGICSISANYSPDNSLSNGINILESFFTNLDILATKVVRKEKNPILGTSRGRGLKTNSQIKYIYFKSSHFVLDKLLVLHVSDITPSQATS